MITIKNIYSTISRYYRNLSNNEVVSFDRYFYMSHNIKELTGGWYNIDKNIVIDFYLKVGDSILATLEIVLDGRAIDDRLTITLRHEYMTNIFGYALRDYIENDINNFSRDFNNAYNEFNNFIKEKYKRSFNENLDALSKEAEERDIECDLEPVHIYPTIANKNNANYMMLKIGRGKLYTISSVDALLARFKNETKHKYGKDLEFKHTLGVLDEASRKLISYMINVSHPFGGKVVNVNGRLLDVLFNSYKGQSILFTDDINEIGEASSKYLIRLNPCTIKIDIDKHYVLSTSSQGKDFIFVANKYVIYQNEAVIDKINGDETYGKLISEIISSPYPCIEDNVDDFKYNYILRYPDKFNIVPEIKEEFVFDTLLIKAYFDFDGKAVYLLEEIFLEDKEVKIEELTYRLLAQYRKYRNIIFSMGFVDNVLKDPSKILEFLSSSLNTLKQYCEVYLSDNILNKHISKFNPPTIRISYSYSMMEVFMEDSRYDDETLFAIIDGLRKKKKYILYKDQIINLEGEEPERFIENVEDYHLAEKGKNNKNNVLPIYYAFKALDNSSGISLNDQIISIFNEIKHFKDNPFKGGKINGELRGYQLEGVKWLDVLYRHYLNGILADDMGLGKTIEIISFLKGEKIKGNVLIIAPKSLVFNWQNEFMKFDHDAKVVSIYGSVKDRESIISSISRNSGTVYLTSYDSFRRDEDLYEKIKFDTVILDEAQYIKNARAKKTAAVNRISSDHRFVLTGTPIENSILDLWSIFNFLMPNYLPDEQEFKRCYEEDENYAIKVRNYVSPFILRRNKADVLKDLPDKYEMIMTSELHEEQRIIYQAYIRQAQKALEESNKSFEVLPIMTRLRQICIHPSLFLENYLGGSGKLDDLNELIDEKIEDGHRLLIFSQFVSALEMVKAMIIEKNLPYFMITGDTKAEERVRLASEFNSTKRIKVGLVSLKAGGTGLNLVGADVVIHLDPWWNLAAQDQATDRAHRIGQERNVEVIRMIAENTIEQRVVELQNAKKDLINKVIADDDSLITSLSLDDIKFILQ